MRKRIFSMLLALVLCFGMTEGVLATEETTTVATDANGLPIPNPSWNPDGSWSITMDMVGADGSLVYVCDLYCNDQKVETVNHHSYIANIDKTMVVNMSDAMVQSGEYKVVVYTYITNADGSITKGTEVATTSKTYIHPGASLGTTVATVDKSRAGVFTFQPVEGAEKYECNLYRIVNGVTTPHGFQRADSYYLNENNIYEVDFSNWLREEGQYFIEIKALSPDVNVIGNGDIGPRSEILNTGAAAETITDKVGNASGYANAAEGLNYLISSSSSQDLQVAMQTDSSVREKISALESNYATQNGITVATPDVSAEAAAYVNPSEISMVGAALNAAAGNNVKLAVTKPATAVSLDSIYSNVVQLDLKLWCDDTNVSTLRVPITITMPIPTGVHPVNLRLMHYHDGATVGTPVTYAISADGKYITFTVDSFSTFVFANEGNPGNDNTPENDNTPGNDTPQYELVPGGWPWNEIVAAASNQTSADTTTDTTTTENADVVEATATSPKTGDMDLTWMVMLCVCSGLGAISVLKKKENII